MKSGVRKDKIIRVKNAVSAGQTLIESDIVDGAECESVEFVVLWGAITTSGVQSVKAQQGALSDMGDGADLAGTGISVADDADNKLTRLEIIKAEERYLRCLVPRATQNSAIDGILAILRYPRVEPVTQSSTVQGAEVHVSPSEGTA